MRRYSRFKTVTRLACALFRVSGLIVILVALATGCGEQSPPEKTLTAVSVQPAEAQAAADSLRFAAEIKPKSQVSVAFRVGGYVERILTVKDAKGVERLAQEGDPVAKDAVLARLRESEYQAKANEARSQVAETKTALDQAALELERMKKLMALQSTSRAELDAANSKQLMAKTRVEQSAAVLEQAKLLLNDCMLKAPMSGVILKRNVEIGSLVGQGSEAFVLADASAFKAVFGVPDATVRTLKVGDAIDIAAKAFPETPFKAQITQIAAAADPKSRVFEIEGTIPNADTRLKVGMVATAILTPAALPAPVTVAPLSAVVRPRGKPEEFAVFVVEQQGGKTIARERRVTLGEAYGNKIALTDGVKVGEKLVVAGATMLLDGQEVRVAP